MIYATVRGLHWALAYWLLCSLVGLLFSFRNVYQAVRELALVRKGEPDEKPLLANGWGSVALYFVISIALIFALLIGLYLQYTAFTDGLHLQFDGVVAVVIVLVIGLSLPTVPSLITFLIWFRWWLTVRAYYANGGRRARRPPS